MILWFFQEKVSNFDLYKCYVANICVTNMFVESYSPLRAVFQVVQFGKLVVVQLGGRMTDMMLRIPMSVCEMPWEKMSVMETMT